jgi:hypothetical protein
VPVYTETVRCLVVGGSCNPFVQSTTFCVFTNSISGLLTYILKMKKVCSFEMSVNNCRTTGPETQNVATWILTHAKPCNFSMIVMRTDWMSDCLFCLHSHWIIYSAHIHVRFFILLTLLSECLYPLTFLPNVLHPFTYIALFCTHLYSHRIILIHSQVYQLVLSLEK